MATVQRCGHPFCRVQSANPNGEDVNLTGVGVHSCEGADATVLDADFEVYRHAAERGDTVSIGRW